MVQIISFTITAAVALSSVGLVAAASCNNGGIYCGRYLLEKGDCINKIVTNLRANEVGTDDFNIQNSLWACTEHGDISFKELCSVGCVGSDTNDDYCNGSGSSKKRDGEAVTWTA